MADFTDLRNEFAATSDILVALGDEHRQAIIVELLKDKVCAGRQVSELTKATRLSRPAVSHHLKVLRDAHIIEYRSEGTKNFYYLTHNTQAFAQLGALLLSVNKVLEAHEK